MTKSKSTSFADKISSNIEKTKSRGRSFGYLTLPKDMRVISPVPGEKMLIDIIPYEVTDPKHLDRDDTDDVATVGSLWYKKPVLVHRNIGADHKTVICPKTIGKPCPICEYRAKRKKEDADEEELKTMNVSRRNLYVVIPKNVVRDKEQLDEVPHILEVSQACFEDQLGKQLDEEPQYKNFPSLDAGYTIKIRFDEEKFGKNSYASAGRIDFIEREKKEQYDEEILNDVPNLDECIKVLSYGELKALLLDVDEEDLDEDEKEEKHTHSERRTRHDEDDSPKRERSRHSDDDDDERSKERSRRNDDTDEKEEKEKEVKLSWDELSEMGPRRLKRLVEEKDLDIKLKKYEDDEDGLREAIAEELEIKIPKKPSKKDDDDEKPKTKERSSSKSKSDGECPEGLEFGKDFCTSKKCDSCKKFDACMDASDK